MQKNFPRVSPGDSSMHLVVCIYYQFYILYIVVQVTF